MSLTADQIQKLKDLGISVPDNPPAPPDSAPSIPTPAPVQPDPSTPLTPQKTSDSSSKASLLPLISISGFSLLSIGGLILFKSHTDLASAPPSSSPAPVVSSQQELNPSPTQVPKSIQHYLLTSQQYFSQALQLQQSQGNQQQVVDNLNQSIVAAASAIQEFPTDYRGYEQRGRIYQSLLDSRPELLASALTDFQAAAHFNATSADLTKEIATVYAKKGDLSNTLVYLARTVSLDPTKAQNFYDLAKLQQQAGLLADAATTYNQLLTLLPDPSQKQEVQAQLTALQTLLKQSPTISPQPSLGADEPTLEPTAPLVDPQSQLLQADSSTGLIIAAPETSQNLVVTGQTDSNSLSGTATLAANQASSTLTNTHITATSQIYVTQIVGGKNETLKVLSKSDGSCTIGFDTPLAEEVNFKWWIIN